MIHLTIVRRLNSLQIIEMFINDLKNFAVDFVFFVCIQIKSKEIFSLVG